MFSTIFQKPYDIKVHVRHNRGAFSIDGTIRDDKARWSFDLFGPTIVVECAPEDHGAVRRFFDEAAEDIAVALAQAAREAWAGVAFRLLEERWEAAQAEEKAEKEER